MKVKRRETKESRLERRKEKDIKEKGVENGMN